MEDVEAQHIIEAALFMSSRPLSIQELGKLIGVAAPGFVSQRVRAVQDSRTAILKEAEIFGARVVDSSVEGFALEATGDVEKLDEFIDIMRSYGEIEVTRSGAIAVSLESKKLRLSPPVARGAEEAKVEERNGVI